MASADVTPITQAVMEVYRCSWSHIKNTLPINLYCLKAKVGDKNT